MAKKYYLTPEGAYKYVLDYLDRFDRTEMQVRRKLKEKGFDLESRTAAVTKAKDYGYIDDERYAERYVEIHTASKGKRRIKRELIEKGIAEAVVDKILIDVTDEDESCYAVAEKFLRAKKRDEKLRERLFRHLVSRGFGYDDVKSTMRKFDFDCE